MKTCNPQPEGPHHHFRPFTKAPPGLTDKKKYHNFTNKCYFPVQCCQTQASLLTFQLCKGCILQGWACRRCRRWTCRCHSVWAREARPLTAMHSTRGRFPACCLISVLRVSPSLLRDTLEEANSRSVLSYASPGKSTLLRGTCPSPDTHRTWHSERGAGRNRDEEKILCNLSSCACAVLLTSSSRLGNTAGLQQLLKEARQSSVISARWRTWCWKLRVQDFRTSASLQQLCLHILKSYKSHIVTIISPPI